MREIKFRAWDGKKWWLVTSISFIEYDPELVAAYGLSGGHYLITGIDSNGNRFTGTSIDTKLVRYTGLKDKNGVEIYEGDIVEWSGVIFNEIFQVKFNSGLFYLDMKSDPLYQWVGLVKVVGNIYENPELLEKEL